MAQHRTDQQRKANRDQAAGTSPAKSTGADAARARSDEQGADRERAIETQREGRGERGRALAERPMTAPVLGSAVSPFAAMRRMMEDMDRLFEDFGFGRRALGMTPWLGGSLEPDLWGGRTAAGGIGWTPQVETFRRGDKLVVRADLPGLRKEDVNVDVDNDTLTITGERRDEHVEDRDGFYRSERSYGQFYRAIPLPEGVNADQCEAMFKDGVLEVTLPAPKELEQRRKRIQVR